MKILDCTIRDGGYTNHWGFTEKDVIRVYESISSAGIEYFEVGFIGPKKEKGKWQHLSKHEIIKVFGETSGSDIGVMINYKTKTTEIPDGVKMVRVATHKDTAIDAILFSEGIKESGYVTSLQLMGYSTMSDKEVNSICKQLNRTSIDYVYVADSYGSIYPHDMKDILDPLLSIKNIKVGFHPHNSLQLAFANSLKAIEMGVDIIDASLMGIGRGSGNLPLELIAAYFRSKYNVIPLLNCIDDVIAKYRYTNYWGYDPRYMLSGVLNIHPYYAKQNRSLERVWRLINEKDRNSIGFSQDVLDDLLDKESDMSKNKIGKDGLLKTPLSNEFRNVLSNKFNYGRHTKKAIRTLSNIERFKTYYKYDKYTEKLDELDNKHSGERAFLIGNGPSLVDTNLGLLKNEITFCANTFFNAMKNTVMKPTYYVVSDPCVLESYHNEILSLDTTVILNNGAAHLQMNRCYPSNAKDIHMTKKLGLSYFKNDFSKDARHGIYSTKSVLYVMLQYAYFMGFKEVYLVGCDFSFSGERFDKSETTRKEGDAMANPDFYKIIMEGLEFAKYNYECDGRKIINSTIGGNLTMFDRKELEEVIN